MSLLPLFSSSSHMLLNSVSKLSLFRAFDDPVLLRVDVEAVVESLKTRRWPSAKDELETSVFNDFSSALGSTASVESLRKMVFTASWQNPSACTQINLLKHPATMQQTFTDFTHRGTNINCMRITEKLSCITFYWHSLITHLQSQKNSGLTSTNVTHHITTHRSSSQSCTTCDLHFIATYFLP